MWASQKTPRSLNLFLLDFLISERPSSLQEERITAVNGVTVFAVLLFWMLTEQFIAFYGYETYRKVRWKVCRKLRLNKKRLEKNKQLKV